MTIAIIALGLACPLGLRSRPAIAAVRAGLEAFELHDDFDRVVARLESADHDPGRTRSDRAEFFATYALRELFDHCAWTHPPETHLAAPEPGPHAGLDVATVWSRLISKSPRPLPRTPNLYPSGRAGAFEALAVASDRIERGAIELAIVGGFDSLADDETLARLDDPRIPGEGAALLLLARSDRLGADTPPALAHVEALELTHDPEPFATGAPPRAAGLAEAFARLGSRTTTRVDLVLSVAPREGWWGREFSTAYLRNVSWMPEPLAFESLYDALGDLGAGAGANALAASILAVRPLLARQFAPVWPRSLAYACSDAGRVGACRVCA